MSEQTDLRLLYLADHHVGTGQMDAAIRGTITHAVAFARLAIGLVFILNAALFLIAPAAAFAIGAHLAALTAVLGFAAMQAEQLARLADREAAAAVASANYNGLAADGQRSAEKAALARTWWRVAGIVRALALASLLPAFACSGFGLLVIF